MVHEGVLLCLHEGHSGLLAFVTVFMGLLSDRRKNLLLFICLKRRPAADGTHCSGKKIQFCLSFFSIVKLGTKSWWCPYTVDSRYLEVEGTL